jgi:hypothetical protein
MDREGFGAGGIFAILDTIGAEDVAEMGRYAIRWFSWVLRWIRGCRGTEIWGGDSPYSSPSCVPSFSQPAFRLLLFLNVEPHWYK